MAPNVLGSYLSDSQSLIGYAWWLNSLLTVIAFVAAGLFSGHADELDDMNQNGQDYNNYNDNNNNQNDNNMRRWNPGSLNSSCLDFAAFYTLSMAVVIAVFGLFAVKKNGLTHIGLGIFIGCLVLYANLCLVCAMIFSQLWVDDFDLGSGDKEELGISNGYRVETSAHVFSIMCMFLSCVNCGFAAVVFFYHEKMADWKGDSDSFDMQQMKGGPSSPYVQY
mmetsp:Transcript_14613/g.22563  ORF Transcript_14613/g.22563 Transcript_14613/m.22563 type:complete len:221 (-) Transcript_14613:125-787(-)|eukprot:CAMPEP_0196815892 /NCGR_PEP_ID=MMETSP1362-20130617/52518_1 /TAXON_ID=163516 /ORGANISM="Leptocylindrus danicus, Strain CCMP1856" /LENGTH=220 /DNA_ID=CAMNT_0042193033 /DNA_START=63 /DNA_END=725 /DNA_ORIENTATION=-